MQSLCVIVRVIGPSGGKSRDCEIFNLSRLVILQMCMILECFELDSEINLGHSFDLLRFVALFVVIRF
jgi:hypothetical protein